MDSLRYVPLPPLSALNRPELEALLTEVLGEVSALKQTVVGLREEIARLKGLKGRPDIKPSGMERGTGPLEPPKAEKPRGRGKVTPRLKIEKKVISIEVPPRSVFKGHEPFLVQDLVISANATCYLLTCVNAGSRRMDKPSWRRCRREMMVISVRNFAALC